MYIDIASYTNNDNIYNLGLEVEIKPWNYGDNSTINVKGKIVMLTNKYGYKVYSTTDGFEFEAVKNIINGELSDCELLELFNILDNIISSL